jgi:hypothetical protein
MHSLVDQRERTAPQSTQRYSESRVSKHTHTHTHTLSLSRTHANLVVFAHKDQGKDGLFRVHLSKENEFSSPTRATNRGLQYGDGVVQQAGAGQILIRVITILIKVLNSGVLIVKWKENEAEKQCPPISGDPSRACPLLEF